MNASGWGVLRSIAGVKALALGALLLAFGSGAAATQARTVSAAQARAAVRFWTPARMARALPLEGPRAGSTRVTVAVGGRVDSGRGDVERLHRRPRVLPPSLPALGAAVSAAPATVSDPTVETARTNGVVFLVTPFGLGRCSGTSVNAPNRSVVVTAGHCLDDPLFRGLLNPRVVFVPAYRYKQRPFGAFPARWMDTTRQWRTTQNENFDVGAFVVGRNESNQRLGEAVGGAGIAWGLKARQVFDVHGYSAEAPFDGETQQLCAGTPFLGHDPRSFLMPGPLDLAVDCEVTGGASGGGWTIEGNVLNGVTDYGYASDPETDFGAYFGREVGRLYTRARRVR